MSSIHGWFALLAVTTTVDGLLAGASVDQSVEQLPARHRIGVRAYSRYSRASHASNGRFWLVPLGIGGAALTIACAAWAPALHLPLRRALPVYLAGGLAVAHTLSSARAIPVNLSQWRLPEAADAELAVVLNRFARWQGLRASLQFLTFAVALWALAVNTGEMAPT
jgi:hypothetical protein